MSFASVAIQFRFGALTILGALLGAASTVHALDTCHLAIYHLPDQPSRAAEWRGFSIDADRELPDFSAATVAREFYERPAGTALVFTTKSDFSLMMRPAWRDPNAPGGAAALSLDAAAFAKAFGRGKPSCAALNTLVARARQRFDVSVLALAFLKNEPAGRAFSWSDFFLAYENAMYLRDGVAIDSNALIETQRQYQLTLREAARVATPDLAGLGTLARLIFRQNHLGAYCTGGNTFSSTHLMGCTACQGSSTAMVAGLLDANFKIPAPYQLGVQMFSDHWRPVLWDSKHLRLKDLTAGGGWITRVTDPIYKPEFLVDTLLRSPISGLAPRVLKTLPAPGAYDFVLVDADEERSLLPTWVQRRMKTPVLTSYSQEPTPSTGIGRYFRTLARTRYNDQSIPATAAMAFREFSDEVVADEGPSVRLTPGIAVGASAPETFDVNLLALMNLPDLAPADRAILDPLKPFATKLQTPLPVDARAAQRAARARFTLGALAERLGGGRLARNAKVETLVAYDRLNLDDLVAYLNPNQTNVAALRARWQDSTLIDRAVLYDRTLNALWTKATHNARFENMLAYLERPIDANWQADAAELEPLIGEIRFLLGVTKAATDYRRVIEGIHLQPALARGDDEGVGMITSETQTLLAALFAHAQNLSRAYRLVVDRGNGWSPETIRAFAQFYKDLDELTSNVLVNDLNLRSVRGRWPEAQATPNLFKRRVLFPLQGLYENLLADADFGAVLRRGPRDGRATRPSPNVGAPAPAKSAVTLPAVDWGVGDPCRGAAPGVHLLSDNVAVECPDAQRQDAFAEGVSAGLIFALILNQPAEYLQTPDVQVRTTLLWTDESEALAAKYGFADVVHRALFAPNPFLMVMAGDRRVTTSAAAPRECQRTSDLGWDWDCVQAHLPDQAAYRPEVTLDLSWLDGRPEYRAGYAKWLSQVKRYRLPKTNGDSENVFMGTDGFWADREYVRRRVAVVDGKVLSVLDVVRAGFNQARPAPTIEQLSRGTL